MNRTPEELTAKPWFAARGGEWWVITSRPNAEAINVSQVLYGNPKKAVESATWVSCMMVVSDDPADDGTPLFCADDCILSADQVESGYRVIPVRADDPRRAAYAWDQNELDSSLKVDQP